MTEAQSPTVKINAYHVYNNKLVFAITKDMKKKQKQLTNMCGQQNIFLCNSGFISCCMLLHAVKGIILKEGTMLWLQNVCNISPHGFVSK